MSEAERLARAIDLFALYMSVHICVYNEEDIHIHLHVYIYVACNEACRLSNSELGHGSPGQKLFPCPGRHGHHEPEISKVQGLVAT